MLSILRLGYWASRLIIVFSMYVVFPLPAGALTKNILFNFFTSAKLIPPVYNSVKLLNVIPIKLPSLRERRGDIPLLINYMIDEYSHKLEKEILGIDENAKQLLINYSWPGNIRELQNVIEYSINMSQSKDLTLESMPKSIIKKKKAQKKLEL